MAEKNDPRSRTGETGAGDDQRVEPDYRAKAAARKAPVVVPAGKITIVSFAPSVVCRPPKLRDCSVPDKDALRGHSVNIFTALDGSLVFFEIIDERNRGLASVWIDDLDWLLDIVKRAHARRADLLRTAQRGRRWAR